MRTVLADTHFISAERIQKPAASSAFNHLKATKQYIITFQPTHLAKSEFKMFKPTTVDGSIYPKQPTTILYV